MHNPNTLTPGLVAQSRKHARSLGRGETTLTRMVIKKIMRSPKGALAVVLLGGGTAAVMTNLLLMQPEKHAYPMFAGNLVIYAEPQPSHVPVPVVRPNASSAPVSERSAEITMQAELLRDIQAELGRRGFYAGQPDSAATARTAQAIRDFQTAVGAPATGLPSEALLANILTSNVKPRDQILGAIRASTPRLERPETVTLVQRALNRLKYGPLSEDGQMGTGTRAALDRFEKDRKLAARGDNPNRVLKELASASGIAID